MFMKVRNTMRQYSHSDPFSSIHLTSILHYICTLPLSVHLCNRCRDNGELTLLRSFRALPSSWFPLVAPSGGEGIQPFSCPAFLVGVSPHESVSFLPIYTVGKLNPYSLVKAKTALTL